MAIAPVVIEFLARGTPAVTEAFKSIADAAARAERAETAAATRGASQRIGIASKEAKARVGIMTSAERDAERARVRDLRSAEKAERDKTRIVEKHAREQLRIHQAARRDVERIEERARARALRNHERDERTRNAESMRWVRQREAEQRRTRNMIVGAGAQGVMAGARRVGSTAMGLASTTAQLGGGFTVAGIVERELGATRAAANVASSTMGQNVSTKDVLSAAKATSNRYGIDTEESVAGIAEFKDLTGDTKRGIELLPEIAKLATAFGGSVEDLAKNAGNISMSSPGLSNKDIMNLLRVQTAQGAAGAVELKDMAALGGRLTAGASLFGGDRSENIASMGAIAQVARQHGGAASPAEAAMAAQRFATDVQKHATDLERQGIKVSDGKGGLRDAKGIIGDMLEKSGGDVTKLTQFGLGERGIRALTGFSDIYRQAGGGEKGKEAVKKEWAKYTTGVSEAEVDKRAASRMQESDKKLEAAFTKLRQAAGEQLLPAFVNMVPELEKLLPQLANAAAIGLPAFTELLKVVADTAVEYKDWLAAFSRHPIASVLTFELTKAFTQAALPSLLQKLFSSAFNGVGGGGPSAGASAPLAGKALGTGIAAAAVTYNSGVKYADGTMQADDLAAKVDAYARGDTVRGVAPEAAMRELETAKGRLKNTNAFAQAANIALSPIDEGASKDYARYKADQALVDSEALKQAISAAMLAGIKEGSAAASGELKSGGNSGANGAARQGVTIRDR